jgi:ArsR family transcriptional regulator, arsenate/arsenite/antimonite-responsive transcriptional repressor / arsenate reductase (thioredoxin)
VDELVGSDRTPVELRRQLGMESNLLAHHLDVLERVGLIERSRSSGDGRRRYVHLRPEVLTGLLPRRRLAPQRALFVCTRNSARSQLAAAVWTSLTGADAESAGTHPAERVDVGAVAAAQRAGLRLEAAPRAIADVEVLPSLVVTVCDRAHEELDPPSTWLHWSVPDPVGGSDAVFDATVAELQSRVAALSTEFGDVA